LRALCGAVAHEQEDRSRLALRVASGFTDGHGQGDPQGVPRALAGGAP
jgi:hypothetical protein